jgi:hypothetical protein
MQHVTALRSNVSTLAEALDGFGLASIRRWTRGEIDEFLEPVSARRTLTGS